MFGMQSTAHTSDVDMTYGRGTPQRYFACTTIHCHSRQWAKWVATSYPLPMESHLPCDAKPSTFDKFKEKHNFSSDTTHVHRHVIYSIAFCIAVYLYRQPSRSLAITENFASQLKNSIPMNLNHELRVFRLQSMNVVSGNAIHRQHNNES